MKLSSMAILLVAVGAMMIPAMPSAMAMPDPSAGGTGPILEDTVVSLTVTEATPAAFTTIGKEISVYNQVATAPKVASLFSCPLAVDSDTDIVSPVWQLLETGGAKTIGYEFDGNAGANPGQITMSFGTSDTNPVTVLANSEAKITKDLDLVDGAEWNDGSGTEPNTGAGAGLPRFMSMLTCGTEGINDFVVGVNFQIVKPVGGIVEPVDTSNLFVAGLSANAMWLSALIGVAGIGLFVVKPQFKRKED